MSKGDIKGDILAIDESKFDFISYKKLVVFGESKVGKSCLIQRLENNTFLEENENGRK